MPRLLLIDPDRFVLRALEKLLTAEGFLLPDRHGRRRRDEKPCAATRST